MVTRRLPAVGRVRASSSKPETDPAEWAKRKISEKRKTFLSPKENPHIKGIKGYPSNAGYLKWLARFSDKFDRDDAFVVASGDKTKFIAVVHQEIELEVKKYTELLAELELSPEEVSAYILALYENLTKWQNLLKFPGVKKDPDINSFISETEDTIGEYSRLLARLKGKH